MNVLDLASKRVQLRKVSATNGGEYQGPCPDPCCGGTDRFHVWPEQNETKGAYWCRGCGRTGDNIQYLRDFDGMSFQEACAYLHIDLPARPESRPSGPGSAPQGKPEFTPEQRITPVDLWQERAEKLITWAQENLARNAEVLAWLAARGIGAEAAVNFRLGWNPGDDKGRDLYRPRQVWGLPEVLREDKRARALCIPRGLLIPYIFSGVVYRIRIRRPEAHRVPEWPAPYYVLPGSSKATMIIGPERRAFVIIESELDAIAVASKNSLLYGTVGLGSASAKPDAETYSILCGALALLNALDYDAAGSKAIKWWADHFERCDRWPVTKGKDPGEAFRLGIDLDRWIRAGLPPALTIDDKYVHPGAVRDNLPGKEAKNTFSPDEVASAPRSDLPGAVLELWELLRKNPSVKITNTVEHFTVLRGGKFVGGRINELVYRTQAVTDYLSDHPAKEIDGANFVWNKKG